VKTPISYYGGKQRLAATILRIILPHKIYVEPFFGGGAVFFAKPPSAFEVINDINGEAVNFYRVLKNDFDGLKKLIESTLHSRELYRQSKIIYNNPDMFSRKKMAWAFWTQTNMSFSNNINSGYGYSLKEKTSSTKKIKNKIENFTNEYVRRLSNTEIECSPALKVIAKRDATETFFYIDPPYPGTCQGHYKGYAIDDLIELLKLLTNIKGKFLLSSFNNDVLEEHTVKNGWFNLKIEMQLLARRREGVGSSKRKTEVLTSNYPMAKDGLCVQNLFE
jgi:DNA adenine methylase